jgi:hypothetical protein
MQLLTPVRPGSTIHNNWYWNSPQEGYCRICLKILFDRKYRELSIVSVLYKWRSSFLVMHWMIQQLLVHRMMVHRKTMTLKVRKNKKDLQEQRKGVQKRLYWSWVLIDSGKRQERAFYSIVLANVAMKPNKHMQQFVQGRPQHKVKDKDNPFKIKKSCVGQVPITWIYSFIKD